MLSYQCRSLQCRPSCHMRRRSGYTPPEFLLRPRMSHPPGHILTKHNKPLSPAQQITDCIRMIKEEVLIISSSMTLPGLSAFLNATSIHPPIHPSIVYTAYLCRVMKGRGWWRGWRQSQLTQGEGGVHPRQVSLVPV